VRLSSNEWVLHLDVCKPENTTIKACYHMQYSKTANIILLIGLETLTRSKAEVTADDEVVALTTEVAFEVEVGDSGAALEIADNEIPPTGKIVGVILDSTIAAADLKLLKSSSCIY